MTILGKWQKCPKCDGQGTVSKPPYVPGNISVWASATTSHQCDLCKGTKAVFVQQEFR